MNCKCRLSNLDMTVCSVTFFFTVTILFAYFIDGFDVHKILTAEVVITDRAKNIIKNRRGIFYGIMPLNISCWFKPSEGEAVDKFLEAACHTAALWMQARQNSSAVL